jgi:hypothetical protein
MASILDRRASSTVHGQSKLIKGGGVRIKLQLAVLGVLVLAAVAVAGAFGGSAQPSAPAPAAAQKATASLTASRFGTGAAETRPAKIVVANADGSGSRVLTRGRFSFVSPDGSQVAVAKYDVANNRSLNWRLELFARAVSAPTHVIPINCAIFYWSPDSTKLACVSSRRLLVIDAATAAVTTLATGVFDGQVSFSPDSTRLAYVQATSRYYNSNGKLKVIDLATRAITTVRARGAASPVWGPTAIAFSTVQKRGARRFTFNAALIQPDGTGFRQLTRFHPTTELYGLLPRAWSADGTRLLAGLAGLDAWVYREAYAVDPIHGGSRLIAHSVSPAALSRDGQYVIGQTGDAETTGLAGSNIVRVPWARGGRRHILLRHAVEPSFNG